MFKWVKHIHFVGVGGIGMSGIAEVLSTLGYQVSGSDLKESDTTKRLRRHKVKVMLGHRKANVLGAHVVVISSAVLPANPEVVEAKRLKIPVIRRAEMLAELMRLKYGVAIAGTHGKTTTTSMVAQVLSKGGLDPTIVIGGKVNSLHSNARLGKGEFLVAEADESDRSFLHLTPTIAAITNIDPEHLENYRDFDHMRQAYADFANKVPFYGAVVCCNDHPEVRRLTSHLKPRVISYGIDTASHYMAKNVRQKALISTFSVTEGGKKLGQIRLNLPGRHNVSNALASVAVGRFLNIPFKKIAQALSQFSGIERRFQVIGKKPMVVNDYAHHPKEIEAVMNAARAGWPKSRLVVVHQPHRYSRLKSLFPEFVEVLSKADKVGVMKLYAAGEPPIVGVSSRALHAALAKKNPRKMIPYSDDAEEVLENVQGVAKEEDVILFLGAGDIWKLGKEFVQ